MSDFLVLTFVVSWAIYGFYLIFRCERLIKEVRIWKNIDTKRGIWWGVFSLFILMDYKKRYFAKDDLSFLPEYKRIIFHHWVFIAWLILIIIFEQSTSYWTYNPVELTGSNCGVCGLCLNLWEMGENLELGIKEKWF